MKYIRTKDGIYIQCKLKGYENYYCLPRNTNITKKEDMVILNQADTIEELCDEFVSITKDLTPEILVPKYISPQDNLITAWRNRFEDEMCYEDVNIYGAIWTDKGLIYVAKMNEKGELELI